MAVHPSLQRSTRQASCRSGRQPRRMPARCRRSRARAGRRPARRARGRAGWRRRGDRLEIVRAELLDLSASSGSIRPSSIVGWRAVWSMTGQEPRTAVRLLEHTTDARESMHGAHPRRARQRDGTRASRPPGVVRPWLAILLSTSCRSNVSRPPHARLHFNFARAARCASKNDIHIGVTGGTNMPPVSRFWPVVGADG